MRQQLLQSLFKLRANGWEKKVLPYGRAFDEVNATTTQLQNHVNKIKAYRKEIIHNRIYLVLQFASILAVVISFIFCN